MTLLPHSNSVAAFRRRNAHAGGALGAATRRLLPIAASWFALGAAGAGAGGAEAEVAGLKKLSLTQLMDIEVTSVSRRPEALADTASAVQVATGEDIRRSGARRLPEALRLLSNLEVAQIDSRQWAIASRGFNNTTTNKLLVQLDGRVLYTPLYAGVFWDVQDTFLADIDRIEAISGPGATQWGSNAVNGVINITTKNARDTQGGLLTATAGTQIRTMGAARYGGKLAPNVYYRVYGKHTERDSSITANGQDAGDAWRVTQGGFRVDWERTASDQLTLQGDAYQGRINQLGTRDVEVDGANLLARWGRTLGPKSSLTVQTYFDFTHRIIPGSITEHLGIFDLDVQHRMPIGDSSDMIWGGSFRNMNDRVVNPAGLAFLPANVKRNWFSGFVQGGRALLDDQLRLTAGIKWEHNPYTGSEWQPSVRAMWKVAERQRLWGAISRAMRTPSRIDRELFAPAAPPYVIAGGPNFGSEELLAYEIGYRVEPRSGVAVSLATFYHDYDDLRSLEPIAARPGSSVLANGLRGKSYGAELSVDYRVREGWRLKAGYTEMRVSSETKPGSLDRTSTRSQVLDPDRMALLTSQFDLRANMTLDFTGRYMGRIVNQNVPAYAELDVRFSWRPTTSLEFAMTGRNLLDAQHPEFGPALPARREMERSVNGSLTWRF